MVFLAMSYKIAVSLFLVCIFIVVRSGIATADTFDAENEFVMLNDAIDALGLPYINLNDSDEADIVKELKSLSKQMEKAKQNKKSKKNLLKLQDKITYNDKLLQDIHHIRESIFNRTQKLASEIDWDIAIADSVDFTPDFEFNLDAFSHGLVNFTPTTVTVHNLTLLQATMLAFTSSTDLIIAISQIEELKTLMNVADVHDDEHIYPDIPSCRYLETYLLSTDTSKFKLGRFSTAIHQLVNQVRQRFSVVSEDINRSQHGSNSGGSNSRHSFVKHVSEYVDKLSDMFKVHRQNDIVSGVNDEGGIDDAEEVWEGRESSGMPLPLDRQQRRMERMENMATYSVTGPTALDVNTQLSRMAVTYLYMPLIVGSFDANLFHYVNDLSINDDNSAERLGLLA